MSRETLSVQEAAEQMILEVLKEIENPSVKPLGAPGSAWRAAWELGQELKTLRANARRPEPWHPDPRDISNTRPWERSKSVNHCGDVLRCFQADQGKCFCICPGCRP